MYLSDLVEKRRLDRFWFFETMQKIMLKDNPVGWQSWQSEKKVEETNSSWFHGNGKPNGSGGIVGRFGISYAISLNHHDLR